MESFRFVHAARLLLDHQLRGTGAVSDTIRPWIEDATLSAFDHVVEGCLKHQVDLLLLTGDTIAPGDNSVRGPGALIRGCERLAEQNILVVIAPGEGDPWDAWPAGLRWPANVVRLMPDGPDEVPVLRDGHVLAIVRRDWAASANDAPRLLKLGAPQDEPFLIGVFHPAGAVAGDADATGTLEVASETFRAPRHVDYCAIGGGSATRTITVGSRFAHDPGPTQAIGPIETGPRGCTLVTVDPSGKVRRKFLPTSTVRFEQLSLSVTPEHTRDDLLLEMIGALDQLPRHESDRMWLVAWNVSARGPCRELLEDGPARESLLDSVSTEHGLPGVVVQTHEVRLRPQFSDYKRSAEIDAHAEGRSAALGNDLVAAFERCLAARTGQPTWSLQRCLADSSLSGEPWASMLEPLIAELDKGDVALDVRRLGMQWLAPTEERAL